MRAVQNLSSIKEKVELALQLRGHVVECMRDRSGNHLIQKCFTHIPTAEDGHSIEFMLEVRPGIFSCTPPLLSEGRRDHVPSCQDHGARLALTSTDLLHYMQPALFLDSGENVTAFLLHNCPAELGCCFQ